MNNAALAQGLHALMMHGDLGFAALALKAGLDPTVDLRGADLSGADLRSQDLTGFDLTDARLDAALIAGARFGPEVTEPQRATAHTDFDYMAVTIGRQWSERHAALLGQLGPRFAHLAGPVGRQADNRLRLAQLAELRRNFVGRDVTWSDPNFWTSYRGSGATPEAFFVFAEVATLGELRALRELLHDDRVPYRPRGFAITSLGRKTAGVVRDAFFKFEQTHRDQLWVSTDEGGAYPDQWDGLLSDPRQASADEWLDFLPAALESAGSFATGMTHRPDEPADHIRPQLHVLEDFTRGADVEEFAVSRLSGPRGAAIRALLLTADGFVLSNQIRDLEMILEVRQSARLRSPDRAYFLVADPDASIWRVLPSVLDNKPAGKS